VEEVILCVGYKRSQIQRYVGGGRKWGLRVKYQIEQELLGTGGAVKRAEGLISGERLLVMNGDTFVDVNLRELVKFHRSRRALATMAVVKVADSRRYGSLRMDGEGRITAFLEKREKGAGGDSEKGRRPINGGVYVFEKRLLSKIYAQVPISLEHKVFPRLTAGKRAYGFVSDTYFVDIGVPDDLRRAQSELPKRFGSHHPH
jgi:NDP-sugar pyrophosphorylase family protein